MESTRVDGYAAFDEPVGISRRGHTFLATPVCQGRPTARGREFIGIAISEQLQVGARH